MVEQTHCHLTAVYETVVPVLAQPSGVIGMKMRQKIRGNTARVPEIVNKDRQRGTISDVVHAKFGLPSPYPVFGNQKNERGVRLRRRLRSEGGSSQGWPIARTSIII